MSSVDADRIAIFVPSLRGGGAERVMVRLANRFAARGYLVDMVLASAEGPYLCDLERGVNLVDLRAGRIIKSLRPLIRYLRTSRPEAMLSALGHANIVALSARILARVPTRLVVSERNTVSVCHQVAASILERVCYFLIPKLYPKADAICTVSQAVSDDLAHFARLPRHRIQTIYNPFDLQRIIRLSGEPIEHPWFGSDQPPVVLAIGRLSEQKDFSTLIQAFSYVRRTHSARLMILGEGPLRGSLENLAKELGLSDGDVQMPGFSDNPFSYLARCKLFVLSSRWEGLPGALIEAMACGAPVVSTDCLSGPSEILENGRWGKLVPVGDVEALAQAITATLSASPDQLPDVRQRANDFEQERAVNAYLRILGFESDRIGPRAK